LWRSKEARSGPLPNTEKLAIAGLPAVHAAAVIETRLRIARAPHGETIGNVVKRTGSAWSAEEAAVANEVAPGDVLAGGRPLEVAMTEPYAGGH